MKPSVEQIENLLALKRDERPEEGYWQDFLCEFHHRQREEATAKSGLANLTDRISTWLSDLGPSKWAYGAGLAYATVTVAFFLTPRGAEIHNGPTTPVNYQVVPAPAPTVEQLEELDLSPSTQGSAGEQVF
ncbi:MAG: hypothetical protein Q7R22_003110 [Verrucomicrobiota bacterium JB025]|nr:hypothetical protein [Verrucomicrobiota bacterium JB025]